jgi:hypothetical protein
VEIKKVSYGEFPEILGLNKRFKPGGKKLKVVLDVFFPESKKKIDFSSVYRKLLKLLPTLEKHNCGENLFKNSKNHKEIPLEKMERITYIAHLIEHVVIDLQSNITKMDSCSGITCGYKNPEHRFDLFIECKDERVGRFAVFFAVDLVKRLLLGKNFVKRQFRTIELVKYLRKNISLTQKSRLLGLASRIASDLGWTRRSVVSVVEELQEFGFFDSQKPLSEFAEG